MTAPEREALVKVRGALNHQRRCTIFDMSQQQCDCGVEELWKEIDAALSVSPAVTVTEGWKPIETAPDDEPILVRYDNDEIHLIECDGDGYDWQPYDGKNQSAMGISKPTHWHRLPAFSTTPQTGSQE